MNIADSSALNNASTSRLMQGGVVLFTGGMLTVLAVFVLFAAGFSSLPVWLSLVGGVLTPSGLGLGLIALLREHRKQ